MDCYKVGIMTCKEEKRFEPRGNATRTETATLLMRSLDQPQKKKQYTICLIGQMAFSRGINHDTKAEKICPKEHRDGDCTVGGGNHLFVCAC